MHVRAVRCRPAVARQFLLLFTQFDQQHVLINRERFARPAVTCIYTLLKKLEINQGAEFTVSVFTCSNTFTFVLFPFSRQHVFRMSIPCAVIYFVSLNELL